MTLIPILAFALVLVVGLATWLYPLALKRWLCPHDSWDWDTHKCRMCGLTRKEHLMQAMARCARATRPGELTEVSYSVRYFRADMTPIETVSNST